MKTPFISAKELQNITNEFPTPFHLYDEKGIREKARALNKAFAWNKGFKEYFAVKATPTPAILKILQEENCGVDCATEVELLMSHKLGSHQMIRQRVNSSTLEKLGQPLTLMRMNILPF